MIIFSHILIKYMRDIFHKNIEPLRTTKGRQKMGAEKRAYVDEDGEKVILKRNEQSRRDSKLENEITLKASFYLTKIAQILFPKSIPDIHRAYYDNPKDRKSWTLVRKKTKTGEEHDELQDMQQEYLDATNNLDYLKLDEMHEEKKDVIEKLSKLGWELVRQLEECGITHTDGVQAQNFGIDSEDNVIFIEEFRPFEITKGTGNIYNLFKPEKLKIAISKIKDEKQRKQAEKYFERIIALRAEAERRTEKNRR